MDKFVRNYSTRTNKGTGFGPALYFFCRQLPLHIEGDRLSLEEHVNDPLLLHMAQAAKYVGVCKTQICDDELGIQKIVDDLRVDHSRLVNSIRPYNVEITETFRKDRPNYLVKKPISMAPHGRLIVSDWANNMLWGRW